MQSLVEPGPRNREVEVASVHLCRLAEEVGGEGKVGVVASMRLSHLLDVIGMGKVEERCRYRLD